MSSLTSPARVRVQRTAIAAVERARLSLVPAVRARAPRAPFAVLVLAVLGIGVVGLLMFNTHMQQDSFYATRLQHEADALTAQKQQLQADLDALRDPQAVAAAGKKLGMVAPSVPAFIDLRTGRVLGVPTVATAADGIQITPPPAQLPPALKLPPVHKTVVLGTPVTSTANSQSVNGPASTANKPATGRKKANTAAHPGVHR